MRFLWIVALAVLGCAASAAEYNSTASSEEATPEVVQVVEGQVEAYNRGDVEEFLSYYAEDARLYKFPDEMTRSGTEELREVYTATFAEPDLHAEITNRIVQGSFVIDHERVTGSSGPPVTAVAIYQVVDGKIQNVWFIH